MGKSVGRWILSKFKYSRAWYLLRDVSVLRSTVYLGQALSASWREPFSCSPSTVDRHLSQHDDPWDYETNPTEWQRFEDQTELIDRVAQGHKFASGLEIGCAEGLYTELVAERCESLLVLDISQAALAKTRKRRQWTERVQFGVFDLRLETIPGTFDLIVVAGVLEYYSRRRTFLRVREKLAAALKPEGYLLVETTRRYFIIENSWWAPYLIRGKWINEFVSRHPSLRVVSSTVTDSFAITLYQKIGSGENR